MKDFYVGFEGEPEIRFVVNGVGVPEQVLRIWDGYFDAIVERIELESGQWTGLALPYHLHEGWYDGAPWKVPDLVHVLGQWRRIRTAGLSPQCLEVHAAVLELLNTAVECNAEVWISEE
ncbi:hypothetical protein [Myxococcus xanthus]|uniref:Uncharacterized protein n=1 Tax=Myxococcus xanthus TaxID=34 RepID=A0A7Y4ILQ8_MYXXA|nr:hypothetical protein [Myxococcus xanthus]NOJ81601.1 hypothetical protein [Myxococcus xanthus]NOJ89043.1 hypothetical protein [Myxococcus xanthus]